MIRKLFYKIFKRYRRLEAKCITWDEADTLLRKNEGKPESEQWVLAKEEDFNRTIGMVYLERKERITQ
jgi:hypothetical protein